MDIEVEVEVTTVDPENIGERETTVPGSRIVFDEDGE